MTLRATTIEGVLPLSDLMDHFGMTEDERDTFTEAIDGVTWGDASYTLINTYRFWVHFVQFVQFSLVDRITQEWGNAEVWVSTMEQHGIRFIDLEN